LQGLTVRLEEGRIKVARILMDSVVDRQGLVQTGDIILQANGKDVKNPEESGEFIVFKIRPVEPDEDEDESAPAKAAKPKVS
jgi:C-terminal processing protease CtpA/Prc